MRSSTRCSTRSSRATPRARPNAERPHHLAGETCDRIPDRSGSRSTTIETREYRFDLNGSTLARGASQLEIDGITLRFGGVQALRDVSLTVKQGEIHSIIGPNGAGKTSLLNCVNGLYRPQQGSIQLHDGTTRDLTRARPSRIARWGVARSFQNIELFRHMTVVENLLLGRHVHMRHYVAPSFLYFGPARRQEIRERELVEEVIDFLELQAVRKQQVGTLSYGFQKRVELGRALCMQPAVLLLDEPMAGMNAEEKEDMARYILDVNELAGVTVVLIEHDMSVVMDISHIVTVLDFGVVIAQGSPAEVAAEPAVIKAYLGEHV
ncbi:MAG TPA: ABC transporter ATP-binding protein [Gaiellaceae bacterium]|nr:ABC transporter ATP-binding protein [Gaiellaceae bacterium]